MRKSLLLAALLTAAPPALAQTATPATPPSASNVTAEQRAALQQALTRGRALAVLDQASRLSTQDMLARVPNPGESGILGWIGQPEGNGVTMTYYGREGEGDAARYVAIYRAQVLGGRITAPQVFAAGSRPALTGSAARMAAARTAAEAVAHQACGPDFNSFVLPPEGEGPIMVYRLSPRMAAGKVPAGGHFRVTVAADGSIAEEAVLAGPCNDLTITPARAGQRPRPLQVNAGDAALPSELHVFLSLWTQRPLVVTTAGAPRLWGVTGQGIAELQQ